MPSWSLFDLLPGAYVALLAVLLERGLRRWFEALPAAVWGVFAALLALLLGPVLAGGQVLLPLDNLRGFPPFEGLTPTKPHGNLLQGDLLLLVAPAAERVRDALLHGHWPLWNDRAGAGMPLLADPQSQPFQPLVVLAYPFGLLQAPGVTAALRVLLALVFTCLLLRRRGCAHGPALAGAVAYALGGFLQLWLGWPLANSAALLPLLLYAQTLCLESGRRRDEALLVAALGSFLLAGHPETIAFGLLFALAMGAADLRRLASGRGAALRRWAACGAFTAALTAPIWLPALVYAPESVRHAALAREEAAAAAPQAPDLVRSWLPAAAPNAFGNSRFVHYWGRLNSNEDASGFVGTTALLLALLALVPRRRSVRLPGEGTALAAAAAVLALLAVPPAWLAPLRALPLGNVLFAHGGRRSLMLLALSLAYLAACQLERIGRQGPNRPALLVAGLALAGLLAWAYLTHPDPQDPSRLEVLRIGWLHWQLRFLLAAVAVIAFLPRLRIGALLVTALLAAELLLAHGSANPPMPKTASLPHPPALEGLIAASAPGDRIAGLGEALAPNLASLYGLTDVRIYNPMAPADYDELLAPVLANPGAPVPELQAADHALLDLLGMRFVLAGADTLLPPPLEPRLPGTDAWVWERPAPRPRLFLAGATSLSEPAAMASRLAVLAASGPQIRARAELARPALLASSVYRHRERRPCCGDGGWRLLLDGRPLPTFRAHGPLLAAHLPAGRWRLELLYRPPGFLFGCWLAALAAAATGMRWWAPPRPPTALRDG